LRYGRAILATGRTSGQGSNELARFHQRAAAMANLILDVAGQLSKCFSKPARQKNWIVSKPA